MARQKGVIKLKLREVGRRRSEVPATPDKRRLTQQTRTQTTDRRKMTAKNFNRILLFSLFGMTMWFFGNLYEAIVIVPNMLTNSILKAKLWQDFFVITNPVFYYIPISPSAVLTTVFLYFKTSQRNSTLKRRLKFATIFGLIASALGIIIITRINLKLFFGDVEKISETAHYLSVWWNILNAVRVLLLLVTIINLFKAYVLTQRNISN
jgi:hypothetical protein